MPIKLYTGLPGNGKTAFMVEELERLAKQKDLKRPLFAHGIDGLRPGLATDLPNAREWNAVDFQATGDCDCKSGVGDVLRAEGLKEFTSPGVQNPVWLEQLQVGRPHAHVIPGGALIFIDEAWRDFGHLHDATRQATPKHVLALAEHRHRGIDFVWTTQQPLQLYPFARALIQGHIHCVRKFGTQFVDLFEWQELNEDVKSGAKRERATKTTRMLPKEIFGSYSGAEVHTIKAKIPLRIFVIPAAVLGVIALIAGLANYYKPSAVQARMKEDQEPSSALAEPAPGRRPPGKPEPQAWTVERYVEAHTPRIPTLPWSAPIFDGQAVTAKPELYCASSGAGLDAQGEMKAASCTCFTEQGTRYALEDQACRMIAKQGQPYNPYRAVDQGMFSQAATKPQG